MIKRSQSDGSLLLLDSKWVGEPDQLLSPTELLHWQDYDKEDYPDEDSIMDATMYWAFGKNSFIIQQF